MPRRFCIVVVWVAFLFAIPRAAWTQTQTNSPSSATYLSDDFEGGVGSWSAQSPWAVTTESAHGGTHARSDSPGGNYGSNLNVSIFSPTFSLTVAAAPRLTFWQRRDFAADGYDSGNVWVSTNGGQTYTFLMHYIGTDLTWSEATIDLTAYAGAASVRLAFQVISNGSLSGDGWYIDDVIVNDAAPTTVVPTVTTNAASGIGQTSATLNGTVNPNGALTATRFDYGTTISYGSSVTAQTLTGSTEQPIAASRALACGRQYHFRATATNSGGTTNGLDRTFTTLACPAAPTVTTNPASGIGQTTATFNGTVNPNGLLTTTAFDYGTTISYGSSVSAQTLSGSTDQPIAASRTLACGQQYHFRARGTSSGGTTNGLDRTFTTLACVGAPANVVATATSSSQVGVTWDPVAGAVSYRVYRRSSPAGLALAGVSATSSFPDSGLAPNSTYLYRIHAVDSLNNEGPASNVDIATTIVFTDDPILSVATVIKADHLTELRTAVNAVRATAGLSPVTFNHPIIPGVLIQAIDITELRSSLDEARASLALSALGYTDPILTPGTTSIKAAHIAELRSGVK